MTGRNPNVFYELAIRHATGKAAIQIIHVDEDIPFDVSGIRAIKFDYKDLDSVEYCRQMLGEQIDHLVQGGSAETPVSQALNLQELQRSPQPVERGIAELAFGINELQSQVSMLRRDLDKMDFRIRNREPKETRALRVRVTSVANALVRRGFNVEHVTDADAPSRRLRVSRVGEQGESAKIYLPDSDALVSTSQIEMWAHQLGMEPSDLMRDLRLLDAS